MKIDKINQKLGIKQTEEATDLTEIEKEDELIPYTENPELIKDIDQYKEERAQNIEVLKEARDQIARVITDLGAKFSFPITEDGKIIKIGNKDLEAFAKVVKSLATITDTLDKISDPQKVEGYIDPPQKEEKGPENVTNIQNNFMLNPNQLLDMIDSSIKKANNGDN